MFHIYSNNQKAKFAFFLIIYVSFPHFYYAKRAKFCAKGVLAPAILFL